MYSEWTEVLYSKTEKALEISAYNFFFWYDYYQAGLNTFHQTSYYCVVGEIDVETFEKLLIPEKEGCKNRKSI